MKIPKGKLKWHRKLSDLLIQEVRTRHVIRLGTKNDYITVSIANKTSDVINLMNNLNDN